MARVMFNLDDFRNDGLELLSKNEKSTKTDLLKEAIDLLFKVKNLTKTDSLDMYFGALGNTVDGLEYQRRIRSEWDI
jgi:hypothetical protein